MWKTNDFWHVRRDPAMEQRVMDGHREFVGTRMREIAQHGKESDAERRHEARLSAMVGAVMDAMARDGSQFFGGDAPVAEMADAAVAVYERARGK